MRQFMGLILLLLFASASRAQAPAAPAQAAPAQSAPAQAAPAKPAAAVDAGEMLQQISRKLLKKTSINVKDRPLKPLIEQLAKQHEIPIRIDEKSLKEAGIALDTRITASSKTTLNQVLNAILKDRGMRWVLRDTEVVIMATPKPVKAAPAVAVNGALVMPANQAQQFVPHFRPVWKAEMFFIRRVCKPSKEQMENIEAVADARILAAAGRFAQMQSGAQRRLGAAAGKMPANDPRSLVQESLAETLKAHLTAEQLATYDAEVSERQVAARDMTIHNLVAKLDRDLLLSPEQRAGLEQSLTKNWNNAWYVAPQGMMNLEHFFPAIPDGVVKPHLNARQQEIWRGMRKQTGQVFFGGFGIFGNVVDESIWDENAKDEEEDAKPAPAATGVLVE